MKKSICLLIVLYTSAFSQLKYTYDYALITGINFSGFKSQFYSSGVQPLVGIASNAHLNKNLIFGINILYDIRLLKLNNIDALNDKNVYKINFILKTQQINFGLNLGYFLDQRKKILVLFGVEMLTKVRATTKVDILKLDKTKGAKHRYWLTKDESVGYPIFNPTIKVGFRYSLKTWFFELNYSYDVFKKEIINELGGINNHTQNLSLNFGYYFIGGFNDEK